MSLAVEMEKYRGEDDAIKIISQKVYTNVTNTVQNVSKAIEKFQILNEEDKVYLSVAINHLYRDFTDSTFDLQYLVIRSAANIETKNQLIQVVEELNATTFMVYKVVNFKPQEIVTKIKEICSCVKTVVENLMKIINGTEFGSKSVQTHPVKFQQRLLDIQHDLLIGIAKLLTFLDCQSANLIEIEQMWLKAVQKLKETLERVKLIGTLSEKQFVHSVQYSIQHLQNYKDYIHKVKNNEGFSKELKDVLHVVDGYSVNYLNAISNAVSSDKPIESFISVLEECQNMYKMAAESMFHIYDIISDKKHDKQEICRVKDLLVYSFVVTVNNMNLLNLSIEDLAMVYKY